MSTAYHRSIDALFNLSLSTRSSSHFLLLDLALPSTSPSLSGTRFAEFMRHLLLDLAGSRFGEILYLAVRYTDDQGRHRCHLGLLFEGTQRADDVLARARSCWLVSAGMSAVITLTSTAMIHRGCHASEEELRDCIMRCRRLTSRAGCRWRCSPSVPMLQLSL